MKIVHICISGPYIDNWGYQENLLPEYLTDLGIDNYVVTSKNNFPKFLSPEEKRIINDKGDNYSINNVNINRINTKQLTTSLSFTFGLSKLLKQIKPDVIFHHGLNCTSLIIASSYCKKYKSLLFIDNHADKLNISKNKYWVWFYHKILLRSTVKIINSTVSKYYGVSEGRCSFLKEYYNIESEKIDLLPIGADTKLSQNISSKYDLRKKYELSETANIVVSGGKMGKHKGTDKLIKTIADINLKSDLNIQLVLFGKFEDLQTKEIAEHYNFIRLYGWCNRVKTLELLKLADIACWPVHHTTLIEDAISVDTPLILRQTETTEHLISKNGYWENDNLNEILSSFFANKIQLRKGCEDKKKEISYQTVAKKILMDITDLR